MTDDVCQTIKVQHYTQFEYARDVHCIKPACVTHVSKTQERLRLCIDCAALRLLEGFGPELELDVDAERKVRTNRDRSRCRFLRKRLRRFNETPLMLVNNVVGQAYLPERPCNPAELWPRVSAELLEEAFGHVELRLIAAHQRTGGRARATAKWLGRWQQRINDEMLRRGAVSA